MATPQPFPMFDAAGDRADESDHVDSGAIIAWDKVDGTGSGSVQMLGIRTVVLCLVMCMGRLVTDGECHSLPKLWKLTDLWCRPPAFDAQAFEPISRHDITLHFARRERTADDSRQVSGSPSSAAVPRKG